MRRWRKTFNGHPENDLAPPPLKGEEVFQKVKDIDVVLGKFEKQVTESTTWKKNQSFGISLIGVILR